MCQKCVCIGKSLMILWIFWVRPRKKITYLNFAFFFIENLATEVESWDNQKKLRDMAIPLSQKKVMRSQYEKCPKIKLSKWMTFRFGIRKCGFGLCSLMASLCRMVRSWCRPLIGKLGVKIRKLKVYFKTGGTWRRVSQWTLIMIFKKKIYSA